MKDLLTSSVARLRLLAFLEGVSLLVLVLVAVPLKYASGDPALSKVLGPVHGALFLLFLFLTFAVALEYRWKFRETTWKVIIACFVPFGTFYVDWKILSKMR
jgi:integral membrane protein